MYDYITILTRNSEIVLRLFNDLLSTEKIKFDKEVYGSKECYISKEYSINFEFIKANNKDNINGNLNIPTVEFHTLRISFKPHYIYNNGEHNGNDFDIYNALNTLNKIFDYIGIHKHEYDEFKITSLEFGVNITLPTCVKEFVQNLYLYKTKKFTKPLKVDYFKHSKTGEKVTKHIKIYAKTYQLNELKRTHENLDINTLRYEIKCSGNYIRNNIGLYNLNDIFKLQSFERMGNLLENELNYILIIDPYVNKSKYNYKEFDYLKIRSNTIYWDKLLNRKDTSHFTNYRRKYNKISKYKKQFDSLVISKINELKKCETLPKEISTINLNKKCETLPKEISTINLNKKCETLPKENLSTNNSLNIMYNDDLEIYNVENNANIYPRARYRVKNFATSTVIERKCIVTNLDISMQQKRTKYLTEVGIKWYKQNKPKVYKEIINNYLPNDIDIFYNPIFYISKNLKELAKQKLNKL